MSALKIAIKMVRRCGLSFFVRRLASEAPPELSAFVLFGGLCGAPCIICICPLRCGTCTRSVVHAANGVPLDMRLAGAQMQLQLLSQVVPLGPSGLVI
jgi:hypothetical protein